MRVSEVYASVQGEGPRVGIPTVFVRFGGCNLRCPGWPCDTQHAIDPVYRHEWERYEPDALAEYAIKVAEISGTRSITLTGGEPFLQKNDDLLQLVSMLNGDGLDVECFSNGTIPYPQWAFESIDFIMDWKLPGSGEDHLNKVRAELNLPGLDEKDAVKFVCKDITDIELAEDLWEAYIKDKSPVQVFYGQAWGTISNAELAGYVMTHSLPWRLNVQLHQYIWSPNERRR
jgi:7-carboxy-7-deazaguanine synthase